MSEEDNKYIVDYMRVTIKPDKAVTPRADFYADDVLALLGLKDFISNAADIGSHDNYTHTFKQGGIRVYTTDYAIMDAEQRKTAAPKQYEHFCNMGISICFTGSGCRSFEALKGDSFKWRSFCEDVKVVQDSGCAINYSRIDIAKDDHEGLLDMSIIAEHARQRKYVSNFRVSNSQERLLPADILETLKGSNTACTVSFGNRKSNSYVRFYDKKAERLCKCNKGSAEYNEALAIPHWVRCEFELRNKIANKLVASLLKLSDEEFSEFLSEVMNKYIRFTEEQYGKTTRRTICSWWSDFIGTVKCASLKSAPIPKNPLMSAMKYVTNSLAPTLEALRRNLGNNKLLSLIIKSSNPEYRFKQKHYDIANTPLDDGELVFSDPELWELLTPYAVKERAACAT